MKVKNSKFIECAGLILLVLVGFTAGQNKPARSQKIIFKTATLSKSGDLRGREFHDFTFSAKVNQNLTLTLTSKKNVNFNLLDKLTMELIEADPSPMQVKDWAGALPQAGEYVIRVFILPRTGPKNRTAAYRLAIALSEPAQKNISNSSKINITANYICDPNAELRADFLKDGRLRLRYGTQDFTLEQALSGSGARYENKKEGVSFWIKGRTAVLNSRVLSGNCKQR